MKAQLRNHHLPRPIMNPVIKHFKIRMRERNHMFASEAMIQSIRKQVMSGTAEVVADHPAGPHKILVLVNIQDKRIPVVFDTISRLPYTCYEAK